METDSQSTDTSTSPDTTNLSASQRVSLLMATAVARDRLRWSHRLKFDEDKVSTEVHKLTADILSDPAFILDAGPGASLRMPTIRTHKKIWQDYRSGMIMADRKGKGGRLKKALSEQVRVLLIEQGLSVRQAADTLENEVSRQLVWRTAKALPMRSYVRPRGQDMGPQHFRMRLDFANAMLNRFSTKHVDLDNIFFTDESMVGCDDGFNRQNDRVWRMKGDVKFLNYILTFLYFSLCTNSMENSLYYYYEWTLIKLE